MAVIPLRVDGGLDAEGTPWGSRFPSSGGMNSSRRRCPRLLCGGVFPCGSPVQADRSGVRLLPRAGRKTKLMSCSEPVVTGPGADVIDSFWKRSTKSLLFYTMLHLCQHPFSQTLCKLLPLRCAHRSCLVWSTNAKILPHPPARGWRGCGLPRSLFGSVA